MASKGLKGRDFAGILGVCWGGLGGCERNDHGKMRPNGLNAQNVSRSGHEEMICVQSIGLNGLTKVSLSQIVMRNEIVMRRLRRWFV